jgi:hypothetical protein
MSFYYLATPYSRYIDGPEEAFREASRQCAVLVRAGVPVFSPIAMTHPVAEFGGIDPLDCETWLAVDRPMMDAAKGLIVCTMHGWQDSYGVSEEIRIFQGAGKPIVFMTPGVVPVELLLRRKVLGLVGYATAGKDAAAAALVQDGWLRVAFADAVREALLELDPLVMSGHKLSELLYRCDFQEAKRHGEVRRLLQRLGTEAGRNIHGQDCWVKIAERKMEETTADVVLTDVRFADEAAFVRKHGGTLVYIERPGVGPINGHVSDAGIGALKVQCDVAIHNDGSVEQLHERIREVVCDRHHPRQALAD